MLIRANSLYVPLADESVHCVVTSPPYWGLRDYKLPPMVWPANGDRSSLFSCRHIWGESIEEHKRGDFGTESTLEGASQDTEARLQTVNQGAFCQLCGAWRGALGLEPTPELYVEHIVQIFREVRRVLRRDGTLWLNMGDCYACGKGKDFSVPGTGRYPSDGFSNRQSRQAPNGLKPKDLVGMPWRVAFALQADGLWLRRDIIWSKPNPMPESVPDRPTTAHEYIFLFTRSGAAVYWTHSRGRYPGTREQPEPDYIWIERRAEEQVSGVGCHVSEEDLDEEYAFPAGWDRGLGRRNLLSGNYAAKGKPACGPRQELAAIPFG